MEECGATPFEDAELDDVPRPELLDPLHVALDQRARLEQQEVGALHRDARTIRIAEVGRHRLERDAPDDTPFIALPGHRGGRLSIRGAGPARSSADGIGLVAGPAQGRSQAPGPGPVAAGVTQRGDPVGHPEPARVEQRPQDTLLRCDLRTQPRELSASVPSRAGLGSGLPRGLKRRRSPRGAPRAQPAPPRAPGTGRESVARWWTRFSSSRPSTGFLSHAAMNRARVSAQGAVRCQTTPKPKNAGTVARRRSSRVSEEVLDRRKHAVARAALASC